MTWYRPPNSTVDKFRLFETLVGRIDVEGVEFYILGDMNCNLGWFVLVLRMSALVIIAWYMFILNFQLTRSKTDTARLAIEILKV